MKIGWVSRVILLTIFVNFVSNQSYSQSNLEFKQVLTYSNTLGNYGVSQTYTVPSGRVWKVESVAGIPAAYLSVNVNGVSIGYLSYGIVFPIWLKSGDTISLSHVSTGSLTCLISILEFNIVQR